MTDPDRDPEAWMWHRARAILEQADRMQRRVLRPARRGERRQPSWEPPVDVFETATELWIVVALPGLEADQVQVEIGEDGLVVHGMRTLPPRLRAASVRRLEIPNGCFERHVELPPGTYELERREFLHGCLFLGLRKIG